MVRMPTVSFLSRELALSSRLGTMTRQLADAQKELATGRHADLGITLGHRTADVLKIRNELARYDAVKQSNALVSMRTTATQSALDRLMSGAQDFVGELLAGRSDPANTGLMQSQARDALSEAIETLNAAAGGVHLFSGIAVDRAPLDNYFAEPAPASRNAVATAFQAHFGFAQDDPQVSGIDASSMQGFLDTAFAQLFDEPQWSAIWSQADDETVSSTVGTSLAIQTSVSANSHALRKIVSAYVMVADLGVARMNEGAFNAVVDTASGLLSEASVGITSIRSVLGGAQEVLSESSEAMSVRIDLMRRHLGELEDVDVAELSTRITVLMERLEATYAFTARLQRLSLLDKL